MTRRESVFMHLGRLRRQYLHSRGLLFALMTVTALVGLLLVFAVTDLILHVPTGVCWAAWSVGLAGLGAGFWIVRRTLHEPVTHAAMAVLVEKVAPGLENHLINAVQFTETMPQNEHFVESLLGEGEVDLARVSHRNLYSQKPRKWCRIALAGMLAVLLVLFLLTPQGMSHAVLRMLAPMAGIEPYTLTQILRVVPGDAEVLRGGNVGVSTAFAGAAPKNARLVWERGRGKGEVVPLLTTDPLPGSGADKGARRDYHGQLRGVFYDCRYRVIAGDAKSRWYTVAVTVPPNLRNWRAEIVPPAYTGRERFTLTGESTTLEVPVGATVGFIGVASAGLKEVRVWQDETVLTEKTIVGRDKFAVKFQINGGGPVKLELTAENGLQATAATPFVVIPDQKPTIVLLDTKQRILAAKDAQIPVGFKADDDYGVGRVGLERLPEEGTAEQVTAATPEQTETSFVGRFILDLASFSVRQGETMRLRVWAEDTGPDAEARRGYSAPLIVTIPAPEEVRQAKQKAVEEARESLVTLINMQRENLKSTRHLTDLANMGKDVSSQAIQDTHLAQNAVRDMAVQLLRDPAALGDLANILSGLVNHEMVEVLAVFEEAHRARAKELSATLHRCVALETHILAALTGIPLNLEREQMHKEKEDLFAALQKLVAGQRQNLKNAKAAQDDRAGPVEISGLARIQDGLAGDLITFTDHCLVLVEQRVEDDFATQIRAVYELCDKHNLYEKMLTAAEALEAAELAAGIQQQEEILRVLLQALDIFNVWRMKNAQKVVKEAAEVLKEVAEKLDELEAKQAKICEVTRDLAARGVLDDEVREKLAEMDEEQKEMAKMVEEMAQDLYQFPELPVCNELNSKMREIYEDVEQAMGSENAPAIEIPVQKEDGVLDAIRATKERVEDVEMWLPDVPDNIVWNMESFDTDEFPDIPLVPLPDELEDIVGELLDQASAIEAQSQDPTGNNIIADMEMGWGIMDGPMPSFAAKGKSGNARPNDNEMTGRSGAGREGQSTGELVENHVKGLEGRKTHARRTRDPFQKGMVTEDEDSTMDARSTGGGKLGGESETVGMFGKAPRRDLHTDAHGMLPTKLRQETEALYATARLLYLGTGSLGTAARELRGVESAAAKMKTFGSLHRRVLRRLEDTQVELASGAVLPMPVAAVSNSGGAVTEDVDINQIAEEYRGIVSDYYRSLDKQ